MSRIHESFSFLVLSLIHIGNYHLCSQCIRPIILPLLFTTTETRLVNSINRSLKNLHIDYVIPIDKINHLNIDELVNKPFISPGKYGSINFCNISFDLIVSMSLQLIILFLMEILHLASFNIHHIDWFLTVSVLTISITYLIPSYLMYYWIFQEERLTYLNNEYKSLFKKIFNYLIILFLWCIIIFFIHKFGITSKINGNILQISLYMISLIGVSFLSMLNGLGCLIGFHELINWYRGKEELIYKQKQLELSFQLRNFDALISKLDRNDNEDINFKIWNEMIKIETILRDLSNFHDGNKGIHLILKYSFWIYCVYKIIYGSLKIIDILFYTIGLGKITENSFKMNEDTYYEGSGDFLSNSMAQIFLFYFYPYLTHSDEVVSEDLLNQMTIIINFIISVTFFGFSFQNVLITFKNIKGLGRKFVDLSQFEIFNEIRHNFAELLESKNEKHEDKRGTNLFQDMICLFACEVTGIYVVSTALLLNTKNIPIHLTSLLMDKKSWENHSNSKDFRVINAEFMNDWFDKWFAFGCIGTLIFMVISNHVRSGYSSKNDEIDEENV